jgi:exosortase F-associated protein
MKKALKLLTVFFLFSLFVVIRAFENELFYDPLILYFQNDYLYQEMPTIDIWKLVVDILFRYVLNALISLAIIYVIFRKKKYIKFTGFFFMVAFIILILIFVPLLRDGFQNGYLFPFYLRRFLIHPLFILLLLPMFYFQMKNNKKIR